MKWYSSGVSALVNCVLLSISIEWISAEKGCPMRCSCTKDLRSIDCSKRHLYLVPKLPVQVERVNLSGNNFFQIKNGDFQQLSSLLELDISSANLARLAPNALFGLTKLQKLHLRANRLTAFDEKTFQHTREIQHLDLSGNRFMSIPDQPLRYLASLKVLNMSGNAVREPVLGAGFQFLPKLQTIDLSYNPARALKKHSFEVMLSWFSVPKYLNLSNCDIREIETETFSKVFHLARLDLSVNRNLPRRDLTIALSNLESSDILQTLIMNRMNISSIDVFHGTKMQHVRYLDLSENNIVELARPVFQQWTSLEKLDLSSNLIHKVSDFTGNSTASLLWLDLSRNCLTDVQQFNLPPLENLKTLNLSSNRLSELHESAVRGLKKLQVMDASCNELRTVSFEESLESLAELCLMQNVIEEFSAPSLRHLRILRLEHNNLTRLGSFFFPHTKRLSVANMSHNRIANVQADAFVLATPKVLDMSHNQLGRVGGWFWQGMRRVHLQHNSIYSVVGGAFYGAHALEHLDLSHNLLPHLVLNSFSNLTSLRSVNFAYNSLGAYFNLHGAIAKRILLTMPRLQTLSLEGNNIRALTSDLFRRNPLLRELNVAQNSLQTLSFLHSGLGFLETLNASKNKIPALKTQTLKKLSRLKLVDLSRNPFVCNCTFEESLEWIRASVSRGVQLGNQTAYRCHAPRRYADMALIGSTISLCPSATSQVIRILIITALISVSVLLVIILTGLVWSRRKFICRRRGRVQNRADKTRHGQTRDLDYTHVNNYCNHVETEMELLSNTADNHISMVMTSSTPLDANHYRQHQQEQHTVQVRPVRTVRFKE